MREEYKGSLNHSEDFVLVDETTGAVKTAGVAHTAVTADYKRTRSAPVTITASDAGSHTAAFTAGRWYHRGGGVHRLDVPDAAYATGAESVIITVAATGCRPESKEIRLVEWNKQAPQDVQAINGSTLAASNLEKSLKNILTGTADSGATITNIPIKTISPTLIHTDQIKGRVLIFDRETATTALRGQATLIELGSTTTNLVVQALTIAPSEDDSFTIQ